MSEPIKIRTIRIRRDTSANWHQKNPILKLGEPGLETDTRKLKFGDGATTWTNLPYAVTDTDSPIFLENIDDRVANLIKAGSNVEISYNDDTDELTINAIVPTKNDLGLDNVDNTSDMSKPVSVAQADADIAIHTLAAADATLKMESAKEYSVQRSNHTGYQEIDTVTGLQTTLDGLSSLIEDANFKLSDLLSITEDMVTSVNGQTGDVSLNKADVGLNNVDNTSDVNKPLSTAQQGALDLKVDTSDARLSDTRIPTDGSVTPAKMLTNQSWGLGVLSGISTGSLYLFSGNYSTAVHAHKFGFPFSTASVVIANSGGVGAITVGEWQSTPVSVTYGGTGATTALGAKTNLGLENVDNTSDANKPISSATQTALNEKANVTNAVVELGTVSGSTAINYDPNTRSIQTLTLNGTSTTLTKGSGWPASSNISVDVILKITVSSATNITWNIVNEWYNQPVSGPLGVGTHLFLLRAVGTTIEGHYIGNRTN